ncbi:MAG: hypothetical protein HC918_12515, partial [Oscillatoriales cyanobacterium SM2_1_8]|nr:hypothetical protein [Oscillatoriales cyanobacterium SM2_1_8]
TRPKRPRKPPSGKSPAQFWVDASTDNLGLAIATDRKYGWDAQPDTLRLSVLRSPEWPCPGSDRGPMHLPCGCIPMAAIGAAQASYAKPGNSTRP